MAFDGVDVPCGFFKNEYVWAANPENAIGKARVNVEAALRREPAVNQEDLAALQLEVDRVEGGLGLSNLMRRQGFVFHRLDADGPDG